MKKTTLLIFAAFLGLGIAAQAQVGVRLTVPHELYVEYEPVVVTVTLRNLSGATLDFRPPTPDAQPRGGLYFEVMDRHGRNIESVWRLRMKRKRGELRQQLVAARDAGRKEETAALASRLADLEQQLHSAVWNAARDLVLPAGGSMSIDITVSRNFPIALPGKYEIRARVEHDQLARVHFGNAVQVRVQEANVVWKRTVGVPDDRRPGENTIPTRRYELYTFEDSSYSYWGLRVINDTHIFGALRLARHAVGQRPQAEIDARNNLHLLIQTESEFYTYWVIDVGGEIKEEARYGVKPNQPRLIRDPDVGRVMVVGGTLAVEGADFDIRSAPVMSVEDGVAPEGQ